MENLKKKIQGIYINLINKNQAINYIQQKINKNENVQIVTINPEMIILSRKNENFKKIINESELVIPDGIGVKIALKLKGINQEQIRGIEFSYELLKLAQNLGWKVGLLGAKKENLDLAVEKIKKEMPNLNIVYKRNGYFDNDNEIIDEIVTKKPQLFLCAMGAPKQEIINAELKNKLTGCVLIGVGGSFDVWSGKVIEAPKIWRKIGLEWLYRTLKEPKRFKRIFPTLPIFLFRCIIEMVGLEAK